MYLAFLLCTNTRSDNVFMFELVWIHVCAFQTPKYWAALTFLNPNATRTAKTLNLLHSEQPKLQRVLAVPNTTELNCMDTLPCFHIFFQREKTLLTSDELLERVSSFLRTDLN